MSFKFGKNVFCVSIELEIKSGSNLVKQEMSLKTTNGVGLKKEENITQARLSTCT